MLGKLQRGLEQLYRLDPEEAVAQFLIGPEQRDAAGVARSPREQLLLQEDDEGLSIGVFFDPKIMEQIAGRGAAQLIDGKSFGDFMMLVEGVSHFVYVAFKAGRDHKVSALELELQAEVDKYVTCLLSTEQSELRSSELLNRLFKDVEYDTDLDAEEQERYRVANNNALRYGQSLQRRFVAQQRVSEMLVELRDFYRMSFRGKMRLIQAA